MGWVILSADDPLKVLARAEEPVLFAELPFEAAGASPEWPNLTPWVTFADGLQRVGTDEFVVWYGAGDTNVAAARLKVTTPAHAASSRQRGWSVNQ